MEKTQEEIQKELKALKDVRPSVYHHSAFGDDNLAALDAQVEVLEEDLDNDDIHDRFEDEEYALMAALDARMWLDGELDDVDSLANDIPTV